jgi:hypothetical protein
MATGRTVEVGDVAYARPGGASARGTLRMLPLRGSGAEGVTAFVLILPA